MANFDLTTLNGVTFGPNNTSFGPGEDLTPGASVSGPEFAVTSSSNVNIAYINSVTSNSYTISGAVNSYTHGYTTIINGQSVYILPTFGKFQTTGNGLYAGVTLYVHGFTGSSLLLSNYSSVATIQNGTNIGLITPSGTYKALGIFSNSDLGAGPLSPGYNPPSAGPPANLNIYTDSLGITHYFYYNTTNSSYYIPVRSAPDKNPSPPVFPFTFTKDSSQFTPPCFAEGTRVSTVRGEVAVEALEVGDRAVTASGALRPVIWIGSRRVKVAAYPVAADVAPVRFAPGALGEGLPARELRLSPGHAVFLDGVLVPAVKLVNGATVVQEQVDSVRYFHVELDAHDVLLAEGQPCESYLDDGNREVFANADEATALHGRLDPLDRENACAPVLRDEDADREALTAIRTRLHARAEALGWKVSGEAALRLLIDGAPAAALHAAGGRLWMMVPQTGLLSLASRSGRPDQVAPGGRDPRRLGVAVGELRVDGRPVDLNHPAFGAGFWGVERAGDEAWRWTDGSAVLDLDALELDGPALLEIAVVHTAASWAPPAAARLRLVRAG